MRKKKIIKVLFLLLLVVSFSCNSKNDGDGFQKERIEHLVLFKFKPEITQDEKQEVINRFMELNNSLKDGKKYVKIEYGFQNSKEGLEGGFDIGFRVTFNSESDRDYYVGKPFLTVPGTYDQAHDDFKNFVGPYLDSDNGVLVFDYKSNDKGNGSVPDIGYRLDHWVLFKFKQSVTQTEKQDIINRFMALKNSKRNGSPYISQIEYGYQMSKEGLHKNFEICFRVSFTSESDRDYYVGKPFFTIPGTYDQAHDDFKNFVTPYLDPYHGVLVFDYQVIQGL
ncbi:Dabb family protein [Chryseobacterium cucumeris]|uniref:Dabb family protein n=1 Tax=Chryseobacterium cucumeris TaxID=1813611 RepID=UPI0023F39551|nr:Dabb family protein [Chryseobacterium cucumeris]